MTTKNLAAASAANYDRGVAGKFKPASQRKNHMVQMRLTAEQHRAFAKKANDLGLSVSSWLRALGIRDIREGGK